MNKIYAMTLDQSNDDTLYSPVFTMTKRYLGMKDSYENNIYFKIYQNSGDKIFIERNYYISINNDNVYFYCLDYAALDTELKCIYIDNGDDTITVYAKGHDREGVSVCLEVINCPIIGKIKFHNKKPWRNLSDQQIIEATGAGYLYHFSPLGWNNMFHINANNKNKYTEYSVTAQEVRLFSTLTVNDRTFNGEAKICKLRSEHLPLWAYSSDRDYISFAQDYGYNKNNQRIYSKCSVQIYKDGTVKVTGLLDLSTNTDIATLDLYLDINYKRI